MRMIKQTFNLVAKYGWTMTLMLLGAFALGFTWSSSDQLYSNIRLFDRIALMVSDNYVADVDESKMIKAGIDAMLSKLDKYSRFLQDADYMRLRQETDGQFEGIGVSLEFHRDTLTVVSVLEGTPGYRKGLEPGDRILKIDTTSTHGLDAGRVRMLMWGLPGTEVSLSVLRPGGDENTVTIKRENVPIKAIPYYSMISEKMGYIRIAHFSEGCFTEVKAALEDLKGRGMTALVLDLRDNPGGLLMEAVEVAGLFLPENSDIVETRGRKPTMSGKYASNYSPVFLKGGLAVIVNKQTASAAEILAGAIQDHDRGVIIGTDTYGKGLVQQVMQFSDESALKLTTSKYYLPSGRCLQKPDWSTFELLTSKPAESADSVFLTDSGRPVYGGGGIMPDIYVDGFEESDYVAALKDRSCFFDFTVDYLRLNDHKAKIEVNDAIMLKFKKFVADRGFAFLDEERAAFDDFKSKLSILDDETREALKTLDEKLDTRGTWEFDNHSLEIRSVLSEEMTLLAEGENHLYSDILLKNRPEIERARDILGNSKKYLSILAYRSVD